VEQAAEIVSAESWWESLFASAERCRRDKTAPAEIDVVVADFEGTGYGQWQVTGEAFGPGPAAGTLGRQMKVSGFQGEGLVNSFLGRTRPSDY